MSAEFDFLPTSDISGGSSASLSQIQQLVGRLGPLSTRGFIYVSTTRPDITNNPRMIRYLWLDINDPNNPIIKRYVEDRTVLVDADLSWEAVGVSDDGILNAMIADYAVSILNDAGANKIALKHNGTADASKGLFIVRVDSAGQYIEVVSLANVLVANTVPLLALVKGGSDGMALVLDSTNPDGAEWAFVDGNSINSLPLTKLAPGAALSLLKMNALGTSWEAVASNSIIPSGAPAAYQVPQRNAGNTDTVWTTPLQRKDSGLVNANGATINVAGVGGLETIPHGLAEAPTEFDIYLKCLVIDNDWQVDDVVPIEHFHEITTGTPPGAAYYDNTNIYFRWCDDTLRGVNKTTGAAFSLTRTSWRMVARARA